MSSNRSISSGQALACPVGLRRPAPPNCHDPRPASSPEKSLPAPVRLPHGSSGGAAAGASEGGPAPVRRNRVRPVAREMLVPLTSIEAR